MTDKDAILRQLREGQKPDSATVYHPQKFSIVLFLCVIALSLALFPSCTAAYGYVIIFLGNEKMIDASFWPIYTNYPFLVIPQFLLLILLPYLVTRIEKRNRDMVLVLFPEGFIQYKPWRDEKKCQAKVVEYANIQKITRKVRFSGISLGIFYNNGTDEVMFLTTKTNDSLAIREQIIDDYFFYIRLHHQSQGFSPVDKEG